VCLRVGAEATQRERRGACLRAFLQHWSTRSGRHHRSGQYPTSAVTCVVAVIMIKTRDDDDDDDDDNTLCAWRHNMAPPPESLTIISAVNMKTVRLQFTAEFAKTQTTRKNRHCAILPSLCRHCQSKVQ